MCGIPEAKNHRPVDFVFLIVAAFVEQICGEKNNMTCMIIVLYVEVVDCVKDGLLEK